MSLPADCPAQQSNTEILQKTGARKKNKIGKFGNVSDQSSVRTQQIRDRLYIFAMPTKCAAVPSVQNLMPFKCPVNVRPRPDNGSAEFTKVMVQNLHVFLIHGTKPTCKARSRWNNSIKIAKTLGNGNRPVFQNIFVGIIRFGRLLEMELQVQNFFPMQLTCNLSISARPYLAEPSMLFHDQSWLLRAVAFGLVR